MLRLNIEQQRAEIDINIQHARLHINMPERRMKITHQKPEMTIKQEKAEVMLDMDALKANMGLETYHQLTAEAAESAKATVRRSIAETVSTADYISDVAVKGNKVASAARREMLEFNKPVMGHNPVPPGPVEMEGNPGGFEIEWSGYDVSIDWVGGTMPEVYVEPPCSVEVEISKEPRVSISVSEIYIPPSEGRNINTEV